MNHTACKALVRIPVFSRPLQCQSQRKRPVHTFRRRVGAIVRGLNAESGRAYPYNRQESKDDKDDKDDKFLLRSKPAFMPNPSINDSHRAYTEIELPPIREEAYPDANISTTSPYTLPSAEERRLARIPDNSEEYAPPPIASPSIRRSGDRPAPRLDRRNDRDDVLAPPRMTVRRHIPHAAKNSEFIFGTSVVEAAIKAHRRKLYRLYVYAGPNRTPATKVRDQTMKDLAKKHHPDIEIVDEIDLGQLNSMSDSRPHKKADWTKSGYVLDAEKLHKVPLLTLGPVSEDRTQFGVVIAQHTTNPDITLRDQPRVVKCRNPNRFPFILMVDEILDPGNLGAMIRSAYYLGVEAIIISGRNSAPLSAVCIKASAGAIEYTPIYEYTNSTAFINGSKENGWKFYAAIPPPPGGPPKGKSFKFMDESRVGRGLSENPCCLILGQEGEGLRPWLAKLAHYNVGIERGAGTDPVVDSLNVSVAAAILCNRFLNPGTPSNPEPKKENEVKVRPKSKIKTLPNRLF